jgi:hypothetical protein
MVKTVFFVTQAMHVNHTQHMHTLFKKLPLELYASGC